MIINRESYLQKCIVHHPPKYTQKFLSQTQRELIPCPLPPGIVYICMKLSFSTEEGPAKPRPLQTELFFFFLFKHQRRGIADEGNREISRVRCINQGVIWSALTFKISLSCLIAVGQSLLITFSCTECTARLTKWIGLFIRPWGPLEN